ncbi:MAG: trypsin-like serine protease [Anaerolineae bacterium]|nr:trypsin-like serine protease [Anaerolineae bacterium]
MKQRVIAIASVVIAVLLVPVAVGAVTFGEPDGNDHPYVGTLLFVQNGVGYYSCSGTLLSPTIMLTAGHCTEEWGNVNDVTYVRFTEDAMAGRTNYPTLQDWLDNEWILADRVIPHPQFDDYSAFPLTYDIGLVVLSEPVNMETYGELPEEGLLETLVRGKGRKDRDFTVVGYGMQGVINPFYQDDWIRYKGQVSLIEINSTFAGGASAKFSNNPGGGNGSGGSCYGDSGGPLFHKDTNVVGAIVSWGITPCIGVDYQFRMDTAAALDFVREYVP